MPSEANAADEVSPFGVVKCDEEGSLVRDSPEVEKRPAGRRDWDPFDLRDVRCVEADRLVPENIGCLSPSMTQGGHLHNTSVKAGHVPQRCGSAVGCHSGSRETDSKQPLMPARWRRGEPVYAIVNGNPQPPPALVVDACARVADATSLCTSEEPLLTERDRSQRAVPADVFGEDSLIGHWRSEPVTGTR